MARSRAACAAARARGGCIAQARARGPGTSAQRKRAASRSRSSRPQVAGPRRTLHAACRGHTAQLSRCGGGGGNRDNQGSLGIVHVSGVRAQPGKRPRRSGPRKRGNASCTGHTCTPRSYSVSLALIRPSTSARLAAAAPGTAQESSQRRRGRAAAAPTHKRPGTGSRWSGHAAKPSTAILVLSHAFWPPCHAHFGGPSREGLAPEQPQVLSEGFIVSSCTPTLHFFTLTKVEICSSPTNVRRVIMSPTECRYNSHVR